MISSTTAKYLAAAAALGGGVWALYACADADRNTDPRSGTNGCVGDACFDASGAPPGTPPGTDGGGTDGGGYPDPLQGTTKTATLLRGNFQFTEGPVWIGGRLLFSDTQQNFIQELLVDGGSSRFRNDAGGANGNAVDPGGKLVTCEGSNQRIVRSDATKGAGVSAVTSQYNGNPYNSPNDVVVRGDGNVYFTDPNYSGNPNTQDAEAVYRVAPGGGAATRLDFAFDKPNGIALSPDGNTLYVVDNGTNALMAGSVAADGAVSPTFTKLADTPGGDGMAVDDAGNLYVSDTTAVDVFDKTGKALGSIAVAEQPSNCTFGGTDRQTLYITARKGVYSIHLNVPGLP